MLRRIVDRRSGSSSGQRPTVPLRPRSASTTWPFNKTGRRGDREKGRKGEREKRRRKGSPSPLLPVSPSPPPVLTADSTPEQGRRRSNRIELPQTIRFRY